MKNQNILLLGLLYSSMATAADLVPTEFKAIETDLARSELKLNEAYSYRLGLGFDEGHKYRLSPDANVSRDKASIRRDINFSLMLPFSIETGLSFQDNQESGLDHKKQKLGGALWARYHLIQSETLDTSIIVQYDAGTADRNSFHQASRDRSSVAFHIDGSPFAYTQAGFFLGASNRKDEIYQGAKIKSEVLYGTRVAVGSELVKVFGEAKFRSMPWTLNDGSKETVSSKRYEAGVSVKYGDLSLQASALIPSHGKSIGVPESGFRIGLQVLFGKDRSVKSLESKTSSTNASSPVSSDDLSSLNSVKNEQALGQIPIVDETATAAHDDMKATETLTLPGADEFQKWDAAQAQDKKSPESATEKAEREYKAQIQNEAKLRSATAAQEVSTRQAEEARLQKEIAEQERLMLDTNGDFEKELNQYTLPDRDDVSWNGLHK